LFKSVIGVFVLSFSALCSAQSIPSVAQWLDMFAQIHENALFKDLKVRYVKASSVSVAYTPLGVIPGEGPDCVVVIAEGANPKMEQILRLAPTPQRTQALLLSIAAHELGHCLRIRNRQMSPTLWSLAAVPAAGTIERGAMEKTISMEEAYADAYALAYMQEARPELYAEALLAMRSLRYEPAFASPYYLVKPLYERLAEHGFDGSLPLAKRVEAAMQQSYFLRG
jgi:hypothetical protein